MRLLMQVESGSRLEPLLDDLEQCLDDSRDRRFVRQLAAGVLKWRDRLDWILDRFSKRPVATLAPEIRQILRLGAYQVLWLDRVPDHAAVHSAVGLARRHGHPRIAGYVNAILRRVVAEGRDLALPEPAANPVAHLALRFSHPQWLVSRWLARWGPAHTEALLNANNDSPSLYVRLRPDTSSPGGGNGLPDEAEPVAVENRANVFRIAQPEGFFATPAFREGRCYVQDLNAGLAAELLAPRPDARLLDVCAAPGGKSLQLALACPDGLLVAADLSRTRLVRLRDNARRLGLERIRIVVGDATAGGREAVFDGVMVDVPCSGTGVLGRHPDARWRKSAADLADHQQRQLAILEAAFTALRPGGVLVYSTCSLEEEENDGVVDRFLSRHADARLEPAAMRFPGRPWAGRTIQTLPGRDEGDGAYAARILRTATTMGRAA